MQSFLSEDRYSPTYNWLVLSRSPFLKKHERNPVNWLEWSEEAFDKAKREGKLVFVYIADSHCHLCALMGRDSFEDEETAQLLNNRFICIMIDKEEHPDIAALYLSKCQKMVGKGEGPLNVFLTSEQEILYAARYLPRESLDDGMIRFKELITQVYEQNDKNRDYE
ncbi:DUF255 domain-containing protein [Bacillus sp. DTU_2020_1000418_1_SI_GHA_SEK_038]|uniref:DUF255 domain-containing protein n=1 Tax=Bacillus sp. DTU_2020_1000418_1_SI_GHA_SEK_038 TaxID=3077585 RepID=UPI0028F0F541|nr:DUF255 domain-containing protein [Bacillus sp. DTU_2020_1000418_1_SI_GHA_SEK_038]WNS77602.1 DUF255 domain-containing protein [Bacillus sp. DTU_2020_1000418_1_SI_GHA_SEK_038]